VKRITIIINALTDNDIDPGEAQVIAGEVATRLAADPRIEAGVHIVECLGAAQDLTLGEWSEANAAAENYHDLGRDAEARGMTALADSLHADGARYAELADRIHHELIVLGIEP
jgi:hypothetical protein